MRRCVIVLFVCCALALPVLAMGQPCTKIQSGTLLDSAGNVIKTGYDQWGYNYQAHMFNGLYDNYSRPVTPATEGLDNLIMKWSDEWIANVDCNNDGKLDRGLNPKTGISTDASMGWLTNHFEGDYYGMDGELHHYTYFAKIVWVGPLPPAGVDDPWMGRRIWGIYAVIEELQNDPFGELVPVLTKDKLIHPGLGLYR